MPKIGPDFSYENAARLSGWKVIVGVDEAGRGPWAGPVVAGAAILDPEILCDELRLGLDDSKKLKPEKREYLYERLQSQVPYGVGIASASEIDELNILQATFLAMSRAVAALPVSPDYALIDGNRPPILDCDLECIIKGDGKSLSIAAASIIAKVTRDRIMQDLAVEFPGYGWETNSGYGTKKHQMGLSELGVTPHHRKSFKPIAAILSRY